MQDTKNNIVRTIENVIDSKMLTNTEVATAQLNSILKLLPIEIQQLIEGAFTYKRIPKEYMLSSILFAFSSASGLAFKVKSMNYTNYANLYLALIGSRGDVKSPAMDLACSPLQVYDDEEYALYTRKKQEEKNKESFEVTNEVIKRKQLLVQNATIEAAMYTHYQNPYSIGIYLDELSYLIEKISNKNSSEGKVWRTFLLQGNTNKHIDVNRKTTDSYRLPKSYPTLLGSIQHQFIPKMFADGNLESGLMDRMLFTNKLTSNLKISKENMPSGISNNYEISLQNLLKERKAIEDSNAELEIFLEATSFDRIYNYSQDLLNKQSKETNHTKEYISKMMISIHKLSLLAHLMQKSTSRSYQDKITIETVDLAILLNDFFFTNFKIVLDSKKNSIDNNVFVKELITRAVKKGSRQVDIIPLTNVSKGEVSKRYNAEIDRQKLETGN